MGNKNKYFQIGVSPNLNNDGLILELTADKNLLDRTVFGNLITVRSASKLLLTLFGYYIVPFKVEIIIVDVEV